MTTYKDKLGGLADKLKTAPSQPSLQKVQPVKSPAPDKATEVQFNNWIPKILLKRLKPFVSNTSNPLKRSILKHWNCYS